MNQKKGFTLVELLVVIAIIGLLSTLAVIALGSARSKARDARRISDIKQVQTALELHFADQGSYPLAASAVTLGDATHDALHSSGLGASGSIPAGAEVYMGQVPAQLNTPNGIQPYSYTSADGTTYSILFALEGKVGDLGPGALTASPEGVK